MPHLVTQSPPSRSGPAWDIARLYPDQGQWSEAEYLSLNTNHLVEFSDGYVEVLPMPTMSHQLIVQYLSNLLLAFVTRGSLGRVLFAPMRMRLRSKRYREPDIMFMLAEHADRMGQAYWQGADLVMEVVSDENRPHDLDVKRAEYAEAGIPEYWIVDPSQGRITVLKLADAAYVTHREAENGGQVASSLLPGFTVDVGAMLAAGKTGVADLR